MKVNLKTIVASNIYHVQRERVREGGREKESERQRFIVSFGF